MICHHFLGSNDIGASPATMIWEKERLLPEIPVETPTILEEIAEWAYDDFLDGSRLHRAVTPTLIIPRRRLHQILYCPWYLLNLPDHPTMAEKRLFRAPLEMDAWPLLDLLDGTFGAPDKMSIGNSGLS